MSITHGTCQFWGPSTFQVGSRPTGEMIYLIRSDEVSTPNTLRGSAMLENGDFFFYCDHMANTPQGLHTFSNFDQFFKFTTNFDQFLSSHLLLGRRIDPPPRNLHQLKPSPIDRKRANPQKIQEIKLHRNHQIQGPTRQARPSRLKTRPKKKNSRIIFSSKHISVITRFNTVGLINAYFI